MMSDKNTFEHEKTARGGKGETEEQDFKVEDRRHWQQGEDDEPSGVEVEPSRPSVVDGYRQRTEEAERKLLEYIEAFKRHQAEQERVRERLARDVDRKVELKFGELLGELLESLDDLDFGLEHVRGVEAAQPLAEGVSMARDRFLNTLAKHGVERISPEGSAFDPNESEALRVDPVTSADADNVVTETLKPGYRLGGRVIRAAKVAVGRFKKK